jgi:hypothetical protein
MAPPGLFYSPRTASHLASLLLPTLVSGPLVLTPRPSTYELLGLLESSFCCWVAQALTEATGWNSQPKIGRSTNCSATQRKLSKR